MNSRIAVPVLLALLAGHAAAGEETPPLARIILPPPTRTPSADDDVWTATSTTTTAAPLLELSLSEAILAAVGNNAAFRVSRLSRDMTREGIAIERAAFDPVVAADIGRGRDRVDTFLHGLPPSRASEWTDARGAEVRQFLPSGTTVSAGVDRTETGRSHATTQSVSVSQSLLRGFGTTANLARLRLARLDAELSEYELQAAAESLVSQTENAYWDAALAARRIEIHRESLALAERDLEQVRQRVEVGKSADLAALTVEAEVATRREALVKAEGALESARLRLLQLLQPGADNPWGLALAPTEDAAPPENPIDDVEDHVRLALAKRPDLAQARLQVSKGEIAVAQTKNGLLPKLDFFITLSETDYTGSFQWGDGRREWRGLSFGVRFEQALGNRAAAAQNRRALLGLDQVREALQNLGRVVQSEVRSAHIAAVSYRAELEATRTTLRLREEQARAERLRRDNNASTAYQVALVERDLLSSKIAAVEVEIGFRKALTALYVADGSLLARRGITLEK